MSEPLFIVGSPRSGTTLMREVIRRLPGVYVLPDEFQVLGPFLTAVADGKPAATIATHLGESAFASHMATRDLWPDPARVRAAIEGRSPAEAFQAVVELIAAEEGADTTAYWGDKTPENARILDRLRATWPTLRVLHVVRDPREAVLSMHRSWGRSILRSSVVWRDTVRAALADEQAHSTDGSVHTVRFDDLTSEPEKVLAGVAEWLGVELGDGPGDRSLDDVTTGERWGAATGARGVQARPSRWREQLSGRQVWTIESICLEEMTALGYAPTAANAVRRPHPALVRAARARDGLFVLRAFGQERGWWAALTYKTKQRSGKRAWS